MQRFYLLKRLCFGLLLCALWAAVPVRAQDSCEPDCVAVGDWRVSVGLGAGVRSNPLHQGEDIPLVVLPEVSYYGERFFLDNLEMGFTLFEDRRHQFNLLLTPGYDQMYFNRWDPFNFTTGGGFVASASGRTGAASSYSINISAQPESAGAIPGPGPSGSGSAGAVYVPQAERVIINGLVIEVDPGIQTLEGVEGNIITVTVVDSNINIGGVAPGDRVVLDGAGAVEGRAGADLQWDQAAMPEFAVTPRRVSVSVDEQNRYLLNSEAAPQTLATAAQQVPADQVAHRKMAGLAGIEYSYNLDNVGLHLQALSDFTGVHHGQELRLALILPWQLGEQRWALTLGANYKSREILDYYYGISARDVADPALFYVPASAGVEGLLRLDWQKPLSRHWSLRAMLQYVELPREIHTSPLVSDKSVGTLFFGGVYHF
jgi:outer membrane scaffolding protein for murein synthesis (MipA/OmpV family)